MHKTSGPLAVMFVGVDPMVQLELTNTADEPLKSIEVLTVFLKDEETPGGGPSQAHIKFEMLQRLPPHTTAVLPHQTWINGRPVGKDRDQLTRLKMKIGDAMPYVLDISWENSEGKSRFQRIPVGH